MQINWNNDQSPKEMGNHCRIDARETKYRAKFTITTSHIRRGMSVCLPDLAPEIKVEAISKPEWREKKKRPRKKRAAKIRNQKEIYVNYEYLLVFIIYLLSRSFSGSVVIFIYGTT